MIERIEKVARVKGVDYDVSRSFDRKEGYQDQKKKKFSQILNQAVEKKKSESTTPIPYQLELSTRPTQSLFYQDGLNLNQLGVNVNGK